MAIRQIRVIGDEILTKACKPVKEMNERTEELIEDMFETMYENNGCGLAAPQVVFLVETGFHHVGQAGLELLGSSDPPIKTKISVKILLCSMKAKKYCQTLASRFVISMFNPL